MIDAFEVGKPFPGPIPTQEGAHLELWEDGLHVIIQMPDCSKAEVVAFKQSFSEYSYLETKTKVPIAIWCFMFSPKFGELDVNFNARIVKPEYIASYLAETKNAVTFLLLDKNILHAIKLVGLLHEAVHLFHATIRKQLNMEYTQGEYNRYLQGIYRYTTKELFEFGTKFTK